MNQALFPSSQQHEFVKSPRRSTQVADVIRNMILSGELKNGDRLPTESELCQRYEVSRTTLRESIQMLRVKGLLEVTPGRGSFVRAPELSHLFQDLPLLCGLNKHMAEQTAALLPMVFCQVLVQSPRFSTAHMQELGALQLSTAATDNPQRLTVWLTALARSTSNPVLYNLVSALTEVMEPLMQPAFTNRHMVSMLQTEQDKCLLALKAGDHVLAGKILRGMLLQVLNYANMASSS